MIRRMMCALLCVAALPAGDAFAQSAPPRAIRRDIPITNSIANAFRAGTRDSTGRPARNYWQARTDYTINARIDPATSVLSGSETIVVHNTTSQAMTEIRLRLDGNIFRPNAPRAPGWVVAETHDGMVLTRVVVNGRTVSLTPPQQAAPGAQAATAPVLAGATSTLARIVLNDARAAPGGRTTIELDWTFKLPGGPGQGHRTTMRWGDTLYQATQWYPRVAKYDDLRGWETEVYLGPSEFFNNFGRFDVRIDVPAGWIVGATGVLQNPEQVLTPTIRQRLASVTRTDSLVTIVGPGEVGPGQATAAAPNGRLVWHFVADTVNDFAFGTARKYVWTAVRANIPGRGYIPVHMFYTPGNARLYARAPQLGRHALEFYSQLWAPYPFPHMTMIDGPSAGMEYPMVIMSNQGAADHEVAHSWWPMMVGTNETQYGWMDEGFNQYMNVLSAADMQSQAPSLDGAGQSYGRISGSETEPPLMWSANYGGPMYGFQTYSKTPLMLSMLGGIVGDTAVWRAMREYTHAWRFKHPSPWDYMFFMNNALKQDLGWFWYYWLFTTEGVHGSIQNVTTTGARTAVTVRQDGQMPSPIVLRIELEPAAGEVQPTPRSAQYELRFENANSAIVTIPVDVWFDGARSFVADLNIPGRRITKITLDPFGRFPDRDPADNVWPR
jgi:hypothetical protein